MVTRPFLTTLLAVMPALALAGASVPSIPDTPAGHALSGWLEAFNSGDRTALESFEKAHAPWLSIDGQMQLHGRTGGYDLLTIEQSDPLWIVFRAKERTGSARIVGRLVVRSYDPGRITLLSLDPASEKPVKGRVDDVQRTRVLDGAAKLLEEFYVFPEIAHKVSRELEAQRKRGLYRNIADGEIFAIRLTDDLVAASGDKHIAVDFFADAPPAKAPDSHRHEENCGFAKTEQYSPNIGYLKLDSFDDPEPCAATAITTMKLLGGSEALIVDLRDNRGGAPHMAVLISSYLFDEPTHLDDIYDRGQNATEQLWTDPLPSRALVGKPIFVLTSHRTFSAGEQFSYDLKVLKRATLIGETTGGGAHTAAPHRIDDHFFIRVPFGRYINPITKKDWEGTGVEPDVKVPAAEALEVAKKLAAEEINRSRRHVPASH